MPTGRSVREGEARTTDARALSGGAEPDEPCMLLSHCSTASSKPMSSVAAKLVVSVKPLLLSACSKACLSSSTELNIVD